MRNKTAMLTAILAWSLISCATFSSTAEPLRYETVVEYVEVGSLIAASENVRVELGPGRSYWFNGRDGSRWSSDYPTVPSARVIILREGVGIVTSPNRTHVVRHVSGPRVVKRGWYGRIVEQRAGAQDRSEVMTEDGRRFEVTPEGRARLPQLPFEVLVSEDTSRIFVLGNGGELVVVR